AAGESFDHVVAALPSPAPSADAVAAVIAAARARISAGREARAFVAADVPVRDAAARHDVLTRALEGEGAPARVVVFERAVDLDELCGRAAMARHPELGRAAIADSLFALRNACADQGVTAAYRTIYALEACDPGCGWVRVRPLA